jgi:hypothetical protein
MKTSTTVLALVLALATGCGGTRAQAHPPVPLPVELTGGGDTVYYGKVYPLKKAAPAPVFVYERRVSVSTGVLRATHITRDGSGAVVYADSARHTPDYRLTDYTLHGNQLGQSGSVHVEGERVSFRLVSAEGEQHGMETQSDPVVVGPTLVGYILRNLAALSAGTKLPVRFAVLDRLETIGFDLEAVKAEPGHTRIRMKASSFLIARLITPTYFTFDTASGKLVRIEGRVPPKVREGERLHDLDARVEYQFVAAAYR